MVSSKLKLLVLCQLFYPELISTGQTVTEICEALSHKGADINVLCAPPTLIKQKAEKLIVYENMIIKRVWATQFPKLSLAGKLCNHITYYISTFFALLFDKERRPILVFTNPPMLGFLAAFFKYFRKQPFVYVVFDIYPDTAIAMGILGPYNPLTILWRRMNAFIYSQADSIVVIGKCMRENVEKRLSNQHLKKITAIHVWADDESIQKVNYAVNSFTKEWSLEGKFVLLYSGNMGRFHDLETIMETARSLHDQYPNILFLFVGEGYKKQWAQNFAQQHHLKNCQFRSHIDRHYLGSLLNSAHIGLVSLLPQQIGLSVPSKSFGLMAAGVPIVAVMPENCEIARILDEENCGNVVTPGDVSGLIETILYLYDHEKTRLQLGKNGKKAIASKYSLKKAADAYYELFRSL